jgi:hypothetical protein
MCVVNIFNCGRRSEMVVLARSKAAVVAVVDPLGNRLNSARETTQDLLLDQDDNRIIHKC